MTVAPSLLITDDDDALRETLQAVLEPLGFRTLLAADGEEAVEIIRAETIHLALLDMHMPKLTGLDAVRLVHRMGRRLPWILMSAKLDQEILDEARKEDAFSVLAKPVSRRQITGVVRQALASTYGWPEQFWSIRVRITTRQVTLPEPPRGKKAPRSRGEPDDSKA